MGSRAQTATITSLSVFVLVGCGVTLDATRVSSEGNSAPRAIPASGIVYALPRTVLEVIQPVKITVSGNGPLQDVIEPCRRACDATGNNVADDSCTLATDPKVTFLPPELHTVSVADFNRLYRISPEADLFQSLDFKFDIASNGVIDKVDNTASNMGYEVLSAIASTAVKVIGGRASPMMAAELKGKDRGGGRTCYDVSTDVTTVVKSKDKKLACSLMNDVRGCMKGYEEAVQGERKSLNALFDDAANKKLDSKLLASLAANRKERIDAAVARHDEAAALYGLGEAKGKEATYQIVMPVGGPSEFIDFSAPTEKLGTLIETGKARITGTSDTAPGLLPALSKSLKESTRVYWVTAKMPADVSKNSADETALGGGYRYRVPVVAETSLKVTDVEKVIFGPLVESKVIAQYGPIAALPSKFKGKGGHVLVKHWPDSGGLQTVQIGAEAVPTTAVTGVIDQAYAQYKAKTDKAATAAAAAAGADPELDSLTRQQKILALRKEIKELEEALK